MFGFWDCVLFMGLVDRCMVVYLCVGMDCLGFLPGRYGLVYFSRLLYTLCLVQVPLSSCNKSCANLWRFTTNDKLQ